MSIECFFALREINSEGDLINFVYDIKVLLKKGSIFNAELLCATQEGAVAAIVDVGLKNTKKWKALVSQLNRK